MPQPKALTAKMMFNFPANYLFDYVRSQPHDCLFEIEGKKIQAHKTILRAFSPFLDVSTLFSLFFGFFYDY